jgi:hypothetical protein
MRPFLVLQPGGLWRRPLCHLTTLTSRAISANAIRVQEVRGNEYVCMYVLRTVLRTQHHSTLLGSVNLQKKIKI